MTTDQQTDVAEFLRALHPDEPFEIRVFDCPESPGRTWTKTVAGFFDDHDKAASEIQRIEACKPPGIFVTVNSIDPSLLALKYNAVEFGAKKATTDPDITRRRFLFIDIDPVRKSGISSTDDELYKAGLLADELQDFLRCKGWPDPISGMSGNGRYLLYRIDLPNDDVAEGLIESVLGALGAMFNDKHVHIDTTAKNASRVIKVLGTMSRKGGDYTPSHKTTSEHRPHRRSWYKLPEGELGIVSREQLNSIVDKAPDVEEPPRTGKASGRMFDAAEFNLADWIEKHNVPVGASRSWQGGRKWVFAKDKSGSPLCDHESDGAAFINQRASGVIGAGCHHDHCKWGWRDLRQYYEPDAYNRPEANLEKIKKQADQECGPLPSEPDDNKTKEAPDTKPPTVDASDILRALVADLKAGKGDQLFKLGPDLDGIEIGRGYLTGLAAGPGVGKTALAGQVTFEVLEHNPGLRVYVANAETGFTGLLKRELTGRTNVPAKALRFADLTPGQVAEVDRAAKEIETLIGDGRLQVLPIDQCNPMGLAELQHQCKPGFLVVDYLQKFTRRDKDPRLAVNELMAGLRIMASRGWGILCLSATSRTHGKGGSQHSGDQLTLASFKESGEIEFNLDSAYLLRDRGEVTPGVRGVRKVELDCVKNRHGEQDKRQLVFNMPRMRFESIESDEVSFAQFAPVVSDPYDNPFNEPAA